MAQSKLSHRVNTRCESFFASIQFQYPLYKYYLKSEEILNRVTYLKNETQLFEFSVFCITEMLNNNRLVCLFVCLLVFFFLPFVEICAGRTNSPHSKNENRVYVLNFRLRFPLMSRVFLTIFFQISPKFQLYSLRLRCNILIRIIWFLVHFPQNPSNCLRLLLMALKFLSRFF